jgi:hypothetical protein
MDACAEGKYLMLVVQETETTLKLNLHKQEERTRRDTQSASQDLSSEGAEG